MAMFIFSIILQIACLTASSYAQCNNKTHIYHALQDCPGKTWIDFVFSYMKAAQS